MSDIPDIQTRWRTYPEYKDSGIEWLGDIPEHWETVKVQHIFDVINGATPKSSVKAYWNGDILWATPDDLGNLQGKVLYDTSRKITTEGLANCGATLAPSGSLVLSTRAPIGHLALSGSEMCINQGCRILVLRKDNISEYFYYLFYTITPILQSKGQGSTFVELSSVQLKSMFLVVPPPEEQRTTATFLDRETAKLDDLIATKRTFIERLKEKRSALISQAVTRGLNPDTPMKDSSIDWLGDIPEHWEVLRIKFVSSHIGSGKTPTGGSQVYQNEGVIFIRSQNVHFNGLRLSDVVYISDEIDNDMVSSRVKPHDVLLNITGASLGRVSLVPRDFPLANVNQHVCIIRPILAKIEPAFLNYFLASDVVQAQIFATENGTSREGITFQQIANFVIATSDDIQEQRSITEYLDQETAKIDQLIQKTQATLDKLTEYRTALISSAVTGAIDVREEV